MTQGKESICSQICLSLDRKLARRYAIMGGSEREREKCAYVDFALMDMQSQENKQTFIIKQNSFTQGCQNNIFTGANW